VQANLTQKHGAWGDLHIVSELKVRRKSQSLRHRLAATRRVVDETVLFTHYISIRLEQHIGERTTG